jgi:hypothetical protein
VISLAVAAADWVGLVHPEITPPSNFHHLRDTTDIIARHLKALGQGSLSQTQTRR